MAFITENNNVISFAEYNDVVNRDTRLFDSNESLTDDVIEATLIRATERILTQIRQSSWWVSYYRKRDTSISYTSIADIPALDINKIKARYNDFTDLCVYMALSEYILPSVADFGDEANGEKEKIGYYNTKSEKLYFEIVNSGDWYDFDDDGTITSTEKDPGNLALKRIR
jgi:hypothetical protein